VKLKKLIEVALPLDEINRAAAREKSIRRGHPSTLHLWWARRPLAACRAVLFASLVDDPESDPAFHGDPGRARRRRRELFRLLEELVAWESSNDPRVINRARAEIASCVAGAKRRARAGLGEDPGTATSDRPGDDLEPIIARQADAVTVNRFLAEHGPRVLDPFAGGGSIPLEAQRLGLRALAVDLNPVAVLINKALIEIPNRFAGDAAVHPGPRSASKTRRGAATTANPGPGGLADDVRFYGRWMRDRAAERIGDLYPPVTITAARVRGRPDLEPYTGRTFPVVAWLWARTVTSPNPACGRAPVPLVKSFRLCRKKGKEAYVEPRVDRARNTYRFRVRVGPPDEDLRAKIDSGTKVGRGAKFRCLLSDEPISRSHIQAEARAGRLGVRLMAMVAAGPRGRIYLSPDPDHERECAAIEPPRDVEGIDAPIADDRRALWCVPYGLDRFDKLFTPRQLTALVTLSDLVAEVRDQVLSDDARSRPDYADAVATYLAFAVNKVADLATTLVTWRTDRESSYHTFAKQALPMAWDFAELNPLLPGGTGSLVGAAQWTAESLEGTRAPAPPPGEALQGDATSPAALPGVTEPVVCTDPPYYDNIGYADLSDFFYVWLRRSLGPTHRRLFSTVLAPKGREVTAIPHRHDGDPEAARAHFEKGLEAAFVTMRRVANPETPTSIFYAFKQVERKGRAGETASPGWESMLEALIRAGWRIVGTWPMRTELGNRSVGLGTNALASSIVLVCRPRSARARAASRREFVSALRAELPRAVENLTQGNIAPVDLAQAAIGPGMAVYSRYAKVVNADGSALTVRAALALINRQLDETLTARESDLDADTHWAIDWYGLHGHAEGPFGEAHTLATAKGISVDRLEAAGIVRSGRGKVRLLRSDEAREDRPPADSRRLSVWRATQTLLHALGHGGELRAARLVRALESVRPGIRESVRDLSYRLHSIAERTQRVDEARGYNALIAAWPVVAGLEGRFDPGDGR